ncbi:MAG: hypothetical protein HGB10_03405 [Coriobacteriia bacterium]|nr:hypothetical protein [Coriobacteriia bacterium]
MGVIAVVPALIGVDAAFSVGRIHPGVTVGGIDVGGMTAEKAVATLSAEIPKKTSAPVNIRYNGKEWEVASKDLALTYDYNALAASAAAVGRDQGFFANLKTNFSAWFGASKLPATGIADDAKLNELIGTIAADTDVVPVDAAVSVKGTTFETSPAESGVLLDRAALSATLLATFTADEHNIDAPVHKAEADVSDPAAAAAKSTAETMVSAPATITFDKKSWELSEKKLAKLIEFEKSQPASDAPWVLEPVISSELASESLQPVLGKAVGNPARDAKFSTRAGKVTIVPSKVGIGPDFEALGAALTAATRLPTEQPRVVQLHTHKTVPALTTEMARAMNIKKRISTYTTYYTAGNRPRVNNIHLLGDSLDGKLVKPGGTFSFNKAIGQRTAAKGYQEANAIVDGKLVPQLGGGICQVGTTLFNTVFLSGIPVLERHNHSFYISHYPKGRDATVSWGGPDLKFKNDTDDWMLISVSYSAGSITISLYGTDPGYKVTSKTSAFSNEKPFPTEKTKDPKLTEGKTVVEDPGVTGRTCTVTRTVKKDGKVIRVDTFKSVYRPKVEIVRVGTKPKASKPATDTAGPN